MSSKKCNAVHPLNVFTIPLAGPGFQQVIRKQPQSSAQWMDHSYDDLDEEDGNVLFHPRNGNPPLQYSMSTRKADCPKGLESLANLEHLFVKQSQLITDFFLNVDNKYEVLNSCGEFVFLAAETTPPLTRIFCFGGQPFEISINTLPGRGAYSWNAKGSEVLKLSGSPGSCGCGSEIRVSHARKPLGSIEQEGDCLAPFYTIKDKSDKEILQIQGPSKPHCFSCGFAMSGGSTSNLKFEIFSADGKTGLGRIAKQWADPIALESQVQQNTNGGPVRRPSERRRESISVANAKKRDCEMWGIKFPLHADVDTKGLLLSTIFLLEYQYYSSTSTS